MPKPVKPRITFQPICTVNELGEKKECYLIDRKASEPIIKQLARDIHFNSRTMSLEPAVRRAFKMMGISRQ